MSEKSTKVRELLLSGTKYPEITRQTGAASSTIAYHAEKLGLRKNTFVRKTHDWDAVQAYYDEGYCISEVLEHFGIEWSVLFQARKRGTVSMKVRNRARKFKTDNGFKYSDEFMFSENSFVSMGPIKKRFKELSSYSCSMKTCPIFEVNEPTWAEKPLVLHLDHVNGIRNDNRLSNLRWVCPNCHTQTSTYCGRNKGGAPDRI